MDGGDVALVAIAGVQALMLLWMKDSTTDRRELRSEQDRQGKELASVKAHVGVDGNGIIARLDTIEHKLDRVVMELAEQRGARRRED